MYFVIAIFSEEMKFDSSVLCKDISPCYVVDFENLKFYL